MIILVGFAILIASLTGCGGGSSTDESNGTITATQTVPTIASDFKIDITNVQGYDVTDPIEDQYLAVINYLRSLRIKCDDPHAVSGPSDSDMQWNTFLADAATEHSEDMKLSDHYAHDGSGTSNDITGQTFTPVRASKFYERISRNGYTGTSTAENIAIAMSSPTSPPANQWITVMEECMTSTSGHCSNIMSSDLTEFGMHESRADVNTTGWYKVYWTQNFGG